MSLIMSSLYACKLCGEKITLTEKIVGMDTDGEGTLQVSLQGDLTPMEDHMRDNHPAEYAYLNRGEE